MGLCICSSSLPCWGPIRAFAAPGVRVVWDSLAWLCPVPQAWPGSSAQALPSLPPAWTGTALGQPGFTITLQFVLYVFHFSSTEGESWILMKRMIINTTVRLPNNSLENAVSRQKARSENVYAS